MRGEEKNREFLFFLSGKNICVLKFLISIIYDRILVRDRYIPYQYCKSDFRKSDFNVFKIKLMNYFLPVQVQVQLK